PADMIILSTSEPDCLCYVETKNLDGETNLKIRRGSDETSYLQTAKDCGQFKCVIECEKPNTSLYSFVGTLVLPTGWEDNVPPEKLDGLGARQRKIPLSVNAILMRGCV